MGATRTRLLLLAAALAACSAAPGAAPAKPEPYPAPEPPRISVNHKLHIEKELACADCHDPEEKAGVPSKPKSSTCFECHDDLAKESERVRAYFEATRQGEAWFFPGNEYSKDLRFDHAPHLKAAVECKTCHGEPQETAFRRPGLLDLKASCMDCHREKKASLECATCHFETRKEAKPASHDAAFRRAHGQNAPDEWQTAPARNLCSMCHEVPKDCNSCHSESKPSSHQTGGFDLYHGRGLSDSKESPFEETSCSLCHKEQSCTLCHQTNKPRSHSVAFERRLHGFHAEIERQSCRTCHQQDFCQKCHESALPVSHTGNWGSGSQAHCIGCHEPLTSTGCYTCHKNTLGHLAATPLPPDSAHTGPVDCRGCHLTLPHLDNGGNCRRCHR